MSWKLLEYKFAYYHPKLLHSSWRNDMVISDAEYDALENHYRAKCEEEDIDPTVADMVGFNKDRPSCWLVCRKLMSEKGAELK
jgi:hypothetical protein